MRHRSFSFEDLKAFGVDNNENWDSVQDETGRIFVANGRGVLLYDGVSWQVIRTPKTTAVRSLALGKDNRVFAGAQGEFGYLVPDSTSFRFVLLSDRVAEEDAGFGNVWTTRADEDAVYFQAPNHLFVWDGSNLRTVHSEASYHTSFLTEDGLVLRERGIGLVRYADGATRLIPGGEFFADKRVFVLQPRERDWLIGTRDSGFFSFSDGVARPIQTGAADLLSAHWLYTGHQVDRGELLLGTLGGGIVGLGADGRLSSLVDTTTGLPDPYITSINPVRPSGFLATTQNNGLFFFESPGVLSQWAELPVSAVGHLLVTDDMLYVSSGRGLEAASLSNPGQMPSTLYAKTAYMAVPIGGDLYVGTDNGIQVLREEAVARTLLSGEQVMTIVPYRDGFVAGYRNGFTIWADGVSVNRRVEDVRSIAVVGEDIWLATLSDGLLRMRPSAGGWRSDEFTVADGLPANDRLEVMALDGSLRVFSDDIDGVFKLTGGWFERDVELTPLRPDVPQEVWDLAKGPDGVVWIGYEDRIEQAVKRSAGYDLRVIQALKTPRNRNDAIYATDDGSLWLTRESKVVRYDPSVDPNVEGSFEVVLREVRTQQDGRLVSGGAYLSEEGHVSTEQNQIASLPFVRNHLVVNFAVADPLAGESMQYSWRLDPLTDGWSPWSTSKKLNLEALREGDYTLRIRARDAHLVVSAPVEYRFRILPPWYRTWIAYTGYALLGLLFGWFVYRFQVLARTEKAAREQALELERERIYRRKLEEANTRLKQAGRLKDEFLAKTSHELRTPLTAILGFANILKEEIPKDASYAEFLDIIQESGDRLMQTLDDLLEVAELRAGTRRLTARTVQLKALFEQTVSPFRRRAGEKGLYLRLHGNVAATAVIDSSACSRILNCLLDNAVKFTESGGISVSPSLEGEWLQIVVADTGRGIEERFIPQLFDDFKQESEGEARSHNGIGLGLTVVNGLVGLLGGTVTVESTPGSGSKFTVRLPVKVESDEGAATVSAPTAPANTGAPDRPAAEPAISTGAPNRSATTPASSTGAPDREAAPRPPRKPRTGLGV